MKNFLYLLSISALLWLFFNPKGILAYNSSNTEKKILTKKRNQKEKTKNSHQENNSWLDNYIISIQNQDKAAQQHYRTNYSKEIALELIKRNFFKKGIKVLNIKK